MTEDEKQFADHAVRKRLLLPMNETNGVVLLAILDRVEMLESLVLTPITRPSRNA